MLKKLALAGALACLAAGSALAVTGQPPLPGIENTLPDGLWLNGLAGGQNESFKSGIAAAGTTQATATQLPAGVALMEVDTVPSGSGVNLPAAVAGTEFSVYNSTATTLIYYPAFANNGLTGAQDAINGGTSLSVTSASGGFTTVFACAKNGVWSAK